MSKPKILVVVGPTASGKSELAVKLAKKFNGEIVSADSRQIYRGLDLGSGKIEGKWQRGKYVYKDIPHYLIDEASPRARYSVARYQKNAQRAIAAILKHGKLPIICGGTGHWIDVVVFNQTLPQVKPNAKLRAELSALTTPQMLVWLKQLDPARARTIDSNNPRRLLRALEIILTTGQPIPQQTASTNYDAIWLGINLGMEKLSEKIKKRLSLRMKQGLLQEVENLHASGLSWKKLESFGLEYKFCTLYLQGKLSKNEMETQLCTAIRQYAKRQLTWWKRNNSIHWSDSPAELITIAKKLLTC